MQSPQARAAATCFTVVYSTLARPIGLGTAKDVVGEGDWKRLIDQLGQMSLAYPLTVPPSIARSHDEPA